MTADDRRPAAIDLPLDHPDRIRAEKVIRDTFGISLEELSRLSLAEQVHVLDERDFDLSLVPRA